MTFGKIRFKRTQILINILETMDLKYPDDGSRINHNIPKSAIRKAEREIWEVDKVMTYQEVAIRAMAFVIVVLTIALMVK